jgi:hypothetical protein
VNNKIKSLRSYFHKIHSEAKRRKSGDGRDDVVEPNRFLYKYLVFILDGGDNRAGKQSFSIATGTSQATEDSYAPTEKDNNKVSSISNITCVEQQQLRATCVAFQILMDSKCKKHGVHMFCTPLHLNEGIISSSMK